MLFSLRAWGELRFKMNVWRGEDCRSRHFTVKLISSQQTKPCKGIRYSGAKPYLCTSVFL